MSSMKMVNIYPKQAGADSLRNNATHLLSMAINWQQLSNYMWTAGSKYIARNIIKCSWNQFETQTPYPFSSKTLSTWFYLVTIGNPQIISFHLALLNFRFTTKKPWPLYLSFLAPLRHSPRSFNSLHRALALSPFSPLSTPGLWRLCLV